MIRSKVNRSRTIQLRVNGSGMILTGHDELLTNALIERESFANESIKVELFANDLIMNESFENDLVKYESFTNNLVKNESFTNDCSDISESLRTGSSKEELNHSRTSLRESRLFANNSHHQSNYFQMI